MNTLLEKLRKSRESTVESGGFCFTIRRPSDTDMFEYNQQHPFDQQKRTEFTDKDGQVKTILTPSEDAVIYLFRRFITGWNLTELDLIPGGMATPVPFDSDLFLEWVNDRNAIANSLYGAILSSFNAHKQNLEATQGESNAG